MKRRTFGSTGDELPVIGQGTWNLERAERKTAIAALRRGIDAGMTHIDTAEMYGSGKVEELVAEAIAGRRQDVYLASKVLPENASREGTLKACERSLRRLKTEWLDLYLLHWPSDSSPLEDTLEAFAELKRRGRIRAFGVSNFDVEELARAVSIAGEGSIACNQVLYHLQERAIEHDIIPWCKQHSMAVVGYSPFGQGQFPSSSTAAGRVLLEIARKYRATPHQVALAFLIRGENLFTIPMSSNPAHVVENAAAADLRLTPDDIRRIDVAFSRGPRRSGVPML